MPTGAVLLLELPLTPTEPVLKDWRSRMVTDLDLRPDDFYIDGPLQVIQSRDDGPMPTAGSHSNCWVNANLWKAFYSPEYPRGDIAMIVQCAVWIEANCDRARMWYGHDVDDENLTPFTKERRQELLSHLRQLTNRCS